LQMPFMFLSAFADDETVAKVKELGAVDYLVKPLEVRQILPAVEAALAALRARPATSAPPEAAVEAMSPVAIAVGVLMHRNSLSRSAALAMLQSQAREDGRDVDDHALRVIEALELLARPPRG
ncbi:MAG: response regulator, partial [Burkholderiaceae bacterium]|nr:response regulator [Burkholderiaceae bacterium]